MWDNVKYLLKFGGRELLIRVRKYHEYTQMENRVIFFQGVPLSNALWDVILKLGSSIITL